MKLVLTAGIDWESTGRFPDGFWDVLRANPSLRVLALQCEERTPEDFFPVDDPNELIQLRELEELSLAFTMHNVYRFLALCSLPNLKNLTAELQTVGSVKPPAVIRLHSLRSLTFNLSCVSQAALLSFLEVPELSVLKVDGPVFQTHYSSHSTGFLVHGTQLHSVDLSGGIDHINMCLRSLEASKVPRIIAVRIELDGFDNYQNLFDKIDTTLACLAHAEKLTLKFSRPHISTVTRLYFMLPNVSNLELICYGSKMDSALLPPDMLRSKLDGVCMPKLESVTVSYRGSHGHPIAYRDCPELISLAESRHKMARRLKTITFSRELARRTKSRLENFVDNVVGPV